MSSITAALGISQLKKLDKIIKMRQDCAEYLTSRLSKHPEIKTPTKLSGYENIFQMYTIRLQDKQTRDSLHEFLLNKKILTKIYFTPIHLRSYYIEKFGTYEGMLPLTEKIAEEVLTLPIYPNMTSEEKNYLIESVDEFFE